MAGIVIIGGGVTGLSAGIHLLADSEQAHRVTVCERHTVPGGNLTGWVRGGCYIDNCVHWLVGTNPATALYREWVKLGALDGAEIRHPDSLYTCRLDGEEIALWRDAARVERAMLWYSPADGREIRRLFRAVRALQSLSGRTAPADGGWSAGACGVCTADHGGTGTARPSPAPAAVPDSSVRHIIFRTGSAGGHGAVLRRQCRPARRGLCRHGRAHGGTLPVAGRCSPIGSRSQID